MKNERAISLLEERLIRQILIVNKFSEEKYIIPSQVIEMDDGRMGSISAGKHASEHHTGLPLTFLAELEFRDKDGIPVLATLYLYKGTNKIAELDIWKTNFKPLIRIPSFDCE